MSYSPQVLIYIQTVKNFLDKNEESRNYFLENVNENVFFDNLARISEINLLKTGTPELSSAQFEVLRVTSIIISRIDETSEENFITTYESKNIKFIYK